MWSGWKLTSGADFTYMTMLCSLYVFHSVSTLWCAIPGCRAHRAHFRTGFQTFTAPSFCVSSLLNFHFLYGKTAKWVFGRRPNGKSSLAGLGGGFRGFSLTCSGLFAPTNNPPHVKALHRVTTTNQQQPPVKA